MKFPGRFLKKFPPEKVEYRDSKTQKKKWRLRLTKLKSETEENPMFECKNKIIRKISHPSPKLEN